MNYIYKKKLIKSVQDSWYVVYSQFSAALALGVRGFSLAASGQSPLARPIGHFTVVCLLAWPWIGSEAGVTLF